MLVTTSQGESRDRASTGMTEPKRLGAKRQTQAVAIKWAAAVDGFEANDADGKPTHKGGTCPSQRQLLRYLRFLSAKDQACSQLTLPALQSGSAHPFELYFLHLVVSVVIRQHRAFYGMIKSRFGEKFVGHSCYLFQRDILFFLKTQKFIFRNSPSNIPHIP